MFTAKMDVSPLKQALANLKKEAKKAMNDQLQESANTIAANARANCNIPSIASSIQSGKANEGFRVTAGNGLPDPEIAAYHEFGTGDFARATVSGLPDDWVTYAWSFKKQFDGRLPAHPYLYPAFYQELVKYQQMKQLAA